MSAPSMVRSRRDLLADGRGVCGVPGLPAVSATRRRRQSKRVAEIAENAGIDGNEVLEVQPRDWQIASGNCGNSLQILRSRSCPRTPRMTRYDEGGKMRRALSLSYRSPRRKMSIDRGPERAGQRQLVLAHGQKLLVLDIGKIAQLDQGGGDVGRGEHRKSRLAMGARQQAH